MPKKPKTHQIEISKISGFDLTMRCIDSKRSNDMMYMEPNEKLHKLCNQVLWEVIYAYFYNWDGSLYLVLIVYGLVELVIEASCLCSMNVIFIYVIVLDKLCFHMLNFCWSNTKIFLSVLVVFGKYFFFFLQKLSKFQKLCCPILATQLQIDPIASPLRDFS